MSDLRAAALESKAWPFEEARKLLKRYAKGAPEKGYVLFETGYGPSGLPHIGTFGEVARTTMIKVAFEAISDIPTKLICFSDDLDGLRKVPSNVPNPETLEPYLQMPLTAVPDPFGTHDSFGAHNNAMLRRFLDTFGFEYEFYSAKEFYETGQFDEVLKRAVDNYDAIMAIMLKSLREERAATYSIFLPLHPETGRVLYVPMKKVCAETYTVTFDDEDGKEWTVPVTGGNVKLQWKPDFGARWAALGVDFEMYGKEHATNEKIYDAICRALGGRQPNHFSYELFLDENGQKISKSSGNGVSIDQWLTYASTESLAYFMYQKPKTAKRMHFDVIPKAVDEYHQQLRAYHTQDIKAQLNNPVWHIHGGDVPQSDMVVPFSMLLNLASASSAEDKETMWGFINKYAPDATAETHPGMDAAAGHAVRYFNDFVKPAKVYRAPTEQERRALEDLAGALSSPETALAVIAAKNALVGNDDPLPEPDFTDEEFLQSIVFAIGKNHEFEPLRDWFKAIYEVLLGASQGPRFGGFIALYGVEETVTLIHKALAGDLVSGA
ncbi:lysine--tRNA ligase [Shimia sp. R9_1]|uniref:lysine--tRNA ligase n=1 Tax=unclassified Shimia TaxID=2630038 RepID=UPI001ADD39E4|nr:MULTISPECIES: lysine--tRNA ligase [unclassified Shimia]MBO9396633.1 lysine--tRNA ligase [Shimia sp. R9_2]MBO9400194.1 lysine--tRNA ligase [Shimia sp. R9_3]MBO9406494.1 lysine--tRNA ligase [Shimia sp. R9_1]